MNDLDAHLAAIATGDAPAFGRWVAGAETRLRLSLTRYASAVDVEVIMQETLLRLWQIAPRVERDGQGNSLLRVGVRIARNLAIDEIRRTQASLRRDEAAYAEHAPAEVAQPIDPDPLLRRLIAACRELLPKKPAAALAARLEAGGQHSDQALAERLNMRLNTFLQNFGRARKLLRTCLKKSGYPLEAP